MLRKSRKLVTEKKSNLLLIRWDNHQQRRDFIFIVLSSNIGVPIWTNIECTHDITYRHKFADDSILDYSLELFDVCFSLISICQIIGFTIIHTYLCVSIVHCSCSDTNQTIIEPRINCWTKSFPKFITIPSNSICQRHSFSSSHQACDAKHRPPKKNTVILLIAFGHHRNDSIYLNGYK